MLRGSTHLYRKVRENSHGFVIFHCSTTADMRGVVYEKGSRVVRVVRVAGSMRERVVT